MHMKKDFFLQSGTDKKIVQVVKWFIDKVHKKDYNIKKEQMLIFKKDI